MPQVAVKQKAPVLTDEQIEKILQQIADGFAKQLRSPIMHTPSEVGLDFEAVTFPSLDGTTLEDWFIPAAGSNGCNSTFYAMKTSPEAFEGVRCLVAPQPVNTKTIVQKQLGLAGIPVNRIDDLDRRIILKRASASMLAIASLGQRVSASRL